MKWIRTISGRIVLGFVILHTTFTVVAGYGIWQMHQFGRRLRFIRTAYLEIAPNVAQLQASTSQFVDYLNEERLSRALMLKNRELRQSLITVIEDKLSDLDAVPTQLEAAVARTRTEAGEFRAEHARNQLLFDAAFGGDRAAEAAKLAREQLRASERNLENTLKRLLDRLQNEARRLTLQVERAEVTARTWALALGAAATAIAIAVILWAMLTIRPLARLRDGARQVARGDYRGRLRAQGGTEIAELAREFNAMAQAIEEREQELVRSARLAAVGKMAAVITHEVRNPLSSIGLNTELLADEFERIASGGDASEARALLTAMHREVDRLTAITEEYLRFARLPRPRLERERLGAVVRQLVEFSRGDLESRGVRVELALADAEGPEVLVDEAQLRQALLNLVRNAGDAMAQGGALRVAVARAGERAEITVTDTGAGIAAADLAHIFEPFFSTKAGGTGLGLALTQEIVHEHGGRIEVTSVVGTGTTFTVSLPLASVGTALVAQA